MMIMIMIMIMMAMKIKVMFFIIFTFSSSLSVKLGRQYVVVCLASAPGIVISFPGDVWPLIHLSNDPLELMEQHLPNLSYSRISIYIAINIIQQQSIICTNPTGHILEKFVHLYGYRQVWVGKKKRDYLFIQNSNQIY